MMEIYCNRDNSRRSSMLFHYLISHCLKNSGHSIYILNYSIINVTHQVKFICKGTLLLVPFGCHNLGQEAVRLPYILKKESS